MLLESTRQLGVRVLELREQAGVLDSDHGLIRKRLDQLDLTGRVGVRLHPGDIDRSDGYAIAEQRRREGGTLSDVSLVRLDIWELISGGR